MFLLTYWTSVHTHIQGPKLTGYFALHISFTNITNIPTESLVLPGFLYIIRTSAPIGAWMCNYAEIMTDQPFLLLYFLDTYSTDLKEIYIDILY